MSGLRDVLLLPSPWACRGLGIHVDIMVLLGDVGMLGPLIFALVISVAYDYGHGELLAAAKT